MEKVTINGKEYTIDIEKCKEQGLLQEEKWYPKSFEDLYRDGIAISSFVTDTEVDAFGSLRRLIVLRNWWWKNLCNDWRPDWTNYVESKYIITKKGGRIINTSTLDMSRILAFPTVEIRDKFYTVYKSMIIEAAQFI